jgi:hypothetical protein
MAEKLIIEIDLEKGDVSGATKELAKSAEKAGAKAAGKFAKKFGAGLTKSFGNIAKQATKITSALSGIATALIGIQSIRAAQVQEDAINSLNSALLISKNSSIEASKGIQTYASELQKVTRFGDELILKNAALIQSLGDLNEKALKRATTAAADLATALRIDLGSAATLVGKAAAGEVGSFSRFGLVIKKGATNAETLANALDGIESKFGGAAQRDVVTYSGAVDQMSNAFGDVLEEIGKYITQNPKMVKSIKEATNMFVNLGAKIADMRGKFDAFLFVTNSIQKLANVTLVAVKGFELLRNIGDIVFKVIASSINMTIERFAVMGSAIAKILDAVGFKTDLGDQMQKFAEIATIASEKSRDKVVSALKGIADFPLSDALSKKNEELQTFFDNQNALVAENNTLQQETTNATIAQAEASAMTMTDIYGSVFDGFTSGLTDVVVGVEKANAMIADFSKKAGKSLQQGFAKGAANAFAAFGAAIANGDNALEAFGKSLLKSIASQAVTLGTNFMLQGAAMLFSPDPTLNAKGGPLIANGAALAAFGGALGAMSGGGGGASGGSSGGGGGGGATGTASTEELASPEVAVAAEERVNFNLNVEGSFVKESELNGYISDILEEGSSRDATIIPSLVTGLS